MKIDKHQSDALKRLMKIDKTTEAEQIKRALNIYITLRTLPIIEQAEITSAIGKQFKAILDENRTG